MISGVPMSAVIGLIPALDTKYESGDDVDFGTGHFTGAVTFDADVTGVGAHYTGDVTVDGILSTNKLALSGFRIRSNAGVAEIVDVTEASYRDLNLRNLTASGAGSFDSLNAGGSGTIGSGYVNAANGYRFNGVRTLINSYPFIDINPDEASGFPSGTRFAGQITSTGNLLLNAPNGSNLNLQNGGTTFANVTAQGFGIVAANLLARTDAVSDIGDGTHRFRDLFLSRNATIGGNVTLSSSSIQSWGDVALGRNSAGLLEVTNGTTGTWRDLITRGFTATGSVAISQTLTVNGIATFGGTVTATPGLVAGNTAQTSLVPAIIAYRGGGYKTPILSARANASATQIWGLFIDGTQNFSLAPTDPDSPWLTVNGTALSAIASIVSGAASFHQWSGRSRMSAPADGEWLLEKADGTDVAKFDASTLQIGLGQANPILYFGGTTSAFPRLRRSGTTVSVQNGDGSALGGLTCGTATASSIVAGPIQSNNSGVDIGNNGTGNGVFRHYYGEGFKFIVHGFGATPEARFERTASGEVTLDNNAGGPVVFNFNGSLNFAGTMGDSTKVVGTDAPADWIEVKIGGTTRYIPAYAA